MENELEVVNIRLVKEPSLYSEQTLDSPQAVSYTHLTLPTKSKV